MVEKSYTEEWILAKRTPSGRVSKGNILDPVKSEPFDRFQAGLNLQPEPRKEKRHFQDKRKYFRILAFMLFSGERPSVANVLQKGISFISLDLI